MDITAHYSDEGNDTSFISHYCHETTADIDMIVTSIKQAGHIPSIHHSYELAGHIYEKFRNRFFLVDEAKELLFILSQPNIRALFDVHDTVASKDYIPSLPDILPQCDDEDQTVKIVKLIKNNEPLGVTIKKREFEGGVGGGGGGVIYIARVFVGGPADRSGMIQIGDEVHEVNGLPVRGRNIEQVVHILNSCDGAISLKLIPAPMKPEIKPTKVKMRANFSYEPSTDVLIPCKDAGLAFRVGDIMEILSTDDNTWWQARLYYDHTNKTGLVPSRSLQRRRISEAQTDISIPGSPSVIRKFSKAQQSNTIPHSTGSLLSPRQHRKLNKKSKRLVYQAHIKDGSVEFTSSEEEIEAQLTSGHHAVLYEEVELYRPPVSRPRPVVLVGINGVGKNDLKSRLVRENLNYISPLPDQDHKQFNEKDAVKLVDKICNIIIPPVTSRPKKLLETEGRDYNFVSKTEMDRLIQSNRLMEYGEYKGHMYALTLDSIYESICNGRVCTITSQSQSLTTLRCSAIKPLVILIKPPALDKLKQLKIYTGEKSTRKLAMSEMEGMVLSSARIESHYRHLCDEIIINTDYNDTYNKLLSICESANSEEKWVPANWLT